jgi:hypothetical protein
MKPHDLERRKECKEDQDKAAEEEEAKGAEEDSVPAAHASALPVEPGLLIKEENHVIRDPVPSAGPK